MNSDTIAQTVQQTRRRIEALRLQAGELPPLERARLERLCAELAQVADNLEQAVPGARVLPGGVAAGRASVSLQLLAEAGATLASSLDYQTTLSQLSQLLVPTLADFCIIDLLDENGRPQRVEVTFADPSREGLGGHVRGAVERDWTGPQATLISNGESILISDYAAAAAQRGTGNGCDEGDALGVGSIIIVPLRARNQTIGAITLCASEHGRRYDARDLELAQELARRAASAVDHARLYRDARAGLEARNAFLSIASHELKTPLTSLLGYAYVLENSDPSVPEDAQRIRRAVDVIKRQSRRLNELIDHMLDLSRLQQGQFTVVRAPTDLALLLHRVVDELQLTLTNHTLQLDGADDALMIYGDEIRLEQVFHNILGNAVKYSALGGPITITVTRDAADVHVTASDQGIGIPQAALARLFTPFFRASNVGEGSSGFGIGLYIVKEIIERHEGTVAVSSTEGKGSTFDVTLPLATML